MCHLAYSMQAGRKNAAYNRHLLAAVNACPDVKRVILMSSVSVYGRNGLPVVDEESPCVPVGEYAGTKLACETVWREGLRSDCELAVLRPTEIVGVGGRGMLVLIRDALKRPVVGTIKKSVFRYRALHYVAVGNVVAATMFCVRRPQASARENFVISEDRQPENRSYSKMQDYVRKLSRRQPLPSLAVPRLLIRALGEAIGRPLETEQVFDSQRIRAAGFKDAISLRDEVRCMVLGA